MSSVERANTVVKELWAIAQNTGAPAAVQRIAANAALELQAAQTANNNVELATDLAASTLGVLQKQVVEGPQGGAKDPAAGGAAAGSTVARSPGAVTAKLEAKPIVSIAEPIDLAQITFKGSGSQYLDGGTTIITGQVGTDEITLRLDRKLGSPTRGRLFISVQTRGIDNQELVAAESVGGVVLGQLLEALARRLKASGKTTESGAYQSWYKAAAAALIAAGKRDPLPPLDMTQLTITKVNREFYSGGSYSADATVGADRIKLFFDAKEAVAHLSYPDQLPEEPGRRLDQQELVQFQELREAFEARPKI